MSWADVSLRDMEAILHIEDQSLLSLGCHVTHFHHFEEVLILLLVPVYLQNVLKTVQEMVVSCLMLKYKHINEMVDRPFFVG